MMLSPPSRWSLWLGLAAAATAAAEAVQVSAPYNVPEGASEPVDPAFLGLGIEATSLPNFTTNFSQNLFNAISSRTGVPTIVRVGGTSMDHAVFDLSQSANMSWPDGDTGLESNLTLGPAWFDRLGRLENVKYMLQFPLARANGTNHTGAVEFVQRCVDAVGDPGKLQGVEIGNEVDMYAYQGWRENGSYGAADYAAEARTYADLLGRNITGLPEGGRGVFQVFDRSSEVDFEEWSIDNFVNETQGVLDLSEFQSVAAHYYQANDGDDLQSTLLNHSHTVAKTNEYFLPFVRAARAHNFTFILDEVGSSLGQSGEAEPDYGLAASLGAAVWTVDWLLYAMTINVTRVNMHMGEGFPFSAWQPTAAGAGAADDDAAAAAEPGVLAGWYGLVFAADFMGPSAGAAAPGFRIRELATAGGSADVTAYAGYESGRLARVALTNQQLWVNGSGAAARPSETVRLAVPGSPAAGAAVTVKRLTGPSGDARRDVTWAGLDWPYASEGTAVEARRNDAEVLPVRDGAVNVTIEATQALMMYL